MPLCTLKCAGVARYDLYMVSGRARLAVLVVLLLTLPGCAGSAAPQPAHASSPGRTTHSPVPGITSSVRPNDRQHALQAYRRFWVVAMQVDKQLQSTWRSTLAAVASEPLLTDLLDGLMAQHARGVALYGVVVVHPTLIDLQPARASVVDCQDASASGELDADSGAAKTVGSSQTSVAAVLRSDDQGRWRVSELRYLEGSC